MRLRRENLRTGRMLSHFDATDRRKNCSLLFLVEGASDIEPLGAIDRVCRRHIESGDLRGFSWFNVIDDRQLPDIDPQLDPRSISRIEVVELKGLNDDLIAALLGPAIDRLARYDGEQLFPGAGPGAAIGSIARGVQFLDREKELTELEELTTEGKDVILLAPRRSGKSSLMDRLAQSLSTRFITVVHDIERYNNAAELAAGLRTAVSGEGYRYALARARRDWEELVRRSFSELADRAGQEHKRGCILFLDELPCMLDNLRKSSSAETAAEAIAGFLSGLQECLNGLPIQIVTAGSEPLEWILAEAGLNSSEIPPRFAGFERYPLRALAVENPTIEMRRLLIGTGLVADFEDIAWLEQNIDLALPYPAMLFFEHLAGRIRTEGEINTQQLDQELTHFLGATEAFRDIERHIRAKGEGVPGADIAIGAALDVIAQAAPELGAPEERVRTAIEQHAPGKYDQLRDWLLETLPIVLKDQRFAFAAKLLRSWWVRLGRGAQS